jgi:predicted TIM-barrel fold metal-dependent hydrolase
MKQGLQPSRRELLITGTAVLGGPFAVAEPTSAAASEPALPWIDAHSHIWPAEVDRYPLAPGLTKKDLNPPSFTDDELLAVAKPEGVGRVVLIQHSIYHRFDNSYLLDAVKRHPSRFRVQGMVDDHQPGSVTRMKALLSQGVTGFRITPFIRKPAEQSRWLETQGMHEMWKTAAETGQAMCLLINPGDLPATIAMCERHPSTPVVIDHFARIGADGLIRDEDVQRLCQLARKKQTYVKLSAFYALGKKKPPYDDLIPMIRKLLDAYGPERLMWASDAPYQLAEGQGYRASISLIRDRLDFLSRSDREQLLVKTAEKVFFRQ